MRMRKKKHREDRLEACSHLLIEDITKYSGSLKKIFEDDKPMHIEIGCGKGKFITELAARNPGINYIAFEKNLDVLVLASEKIKNAGLENVRFVAGDACVLEQMNIEHEIERIYINFCDPWKKKRQAKRRLTHENFLKLYEKLLIDGGEVHFKTDNTKLFEFSLNSFSAYGLMMKNITLDLHNSEFEGNIMTEYETLFSEKGQPIYRCEVVFPRR
ncbi:MAG: tRNA (guanosine(46)-N7)-methyltransferase TrmB [Clostridia bacterium]|nr:tRNA (guanosine(46)-N7)-methyltransferase TrmB [Clostridia bacterium]